MGYSGRKATGGYGAFFLAVTVIVSCFIAVIVALMLKEGQIKERQEQNIENYCTALAERSYTVDSKQKLFKLECEDFFKEAREVINKGL